MGRWFAGILREEGKEVIVVGRDEGKLLKAKEQLGVEVTADLSTAVEGSDLVLLSVPIDSFKEVAKQIQPLVTPEQTIIDITSVKTLPVEIMRKYLGAGRVLGTHPVFGPGAKGFHNQNFVLTPTDEKEAALAEKVRQYLEPRGARVTLMTPQEHDEMMVIILGLSHFIAIAAADTLLNFERLKQMAAIGGPTFKVLLTLAESVVTEDPELYASLQMNLPQITETEDLFLKSSKTWADIVRKKDREAFVNRMNNLKDKLEKDDPDFGKSYEAMYKLLEES